MSVNYDKLYYTYNYNWTILSEKEDERIYLIYCRKMSGDWVTFTYYVNENRMKLPEGTMIYCNNIDKANSLVYNVLRIHRWQIHKRYLGRYFIIQKLLNKKIEHDII